MPDGKDISLSDASLKGGHAG